MTTRATIPTINSGSPMPSTVGGRQRISNYPDGWAVAAQALGYTRGSLHTKVYQDGGLLSELETICRALVEAGQSAVAASISARIQLACVRKPGANLFDLMAEEQELDGPEDEAGLHLAHDDTAASRDTYRRKLIRYRIAIDDLIVALAPA